MPQGRSSLIVKCPSFVLNMVVLIASVNIRRLRISAGGQCTAMNEQGDSGGEDGTEREQVLHVNSSGRLRFGASRFSVSDMLHEVFLWLLKQSKGKNIKADKVLWLLQYLTEILSHPSTCTFTLRTANLCFEY